MSRLATCMPDACFCESVRALVPYQPANTLSSLAFVVVAAAVVADVRRGPSGSAGSSSSAMSSNAVFPLVYASALVVVGLGSAWYHATLTFAAQFADVMGMYLIAVFMLLYGWARMRPMAPVTLAVSYLALNVLLAGVLYWAPAARRYVFALLILAGLGVEMASRKRGHVGASNSRYLIRAVAALALGFGIWTLDITRTLCSPNSLLQGHALWHVLGAVASYELYRYYRSQSSL